MKFEGFVCEFRGIGRCRRGVSASRGQVSRASWLDHPKKREGFHLPVHLSLLCFSANLFLHSSLVLLPLDLESVNLYLGAGLDYDPGHISAD